MLTVSMEWSTSLEHMEDKGIEPNVECGNKNIVIKFWARGDGSIEAKYCTQKQKYWGQISNARTRVLWLNFGRKKTKVLRPNIAHGDKETRLSRLNLGAGMNVSGPNIERGDERFPAYLELCFFFLRFAYLCRIFDDYAEEEKIIKLWTSPPISSFPLSVLCSLFRSNTHTGMKG